MYAEITFNQKYSGRFVWIFQKQILPTVLKYLKWKNKPNQEHNFFSTIYVQKFHKNSINLSLLKKFYNIQKFNAKIQKLTRENSLPNIKGKQDKIISLIKT